MIYPEECDMSLPEKQALPLETKLAMTRFRIMEWYKYWDGNVYLSDSGGRDSSVLNHIIEDMRLYITRVFLNTGLEFPEINRHVETHPNLVKLQPIKPFGAVIKEEGYPILSKSKSRGLRDLTNPTVRNFHIRRYSATGIRKNGTQSIAIIRPKWHDTFNITETFNGWVADIPFKVSERCCDYLKKKPARDYVKNKKTYPITGTMVSEGGVRKLSLQGSPCNIIGKNPISNPLSFWTHVDILEYIKQNNVKIASVYEMGYERTGCVFCMFGVHLDHRNMKGGLNRFQLLKQTHPKLWSYCMDKLDLRMVMSFLKLPIE